MSASLVQRFRFFKEDIVSVVKYFLYAKNKWDETRQPFSLCNHGKAAAIVPAVDRLEEIANQLIRLIANPLATDDMLKSVLDRINDCFHRYKTAYNFGTWGHATLQLEWRIPLAEYQKIDAAYEDLCETVMSLAIAAASSCSGGDAWRPRLDCYTPEAQEFTAARKRQMAEFPRTPAEAQPWVNPGRDYFLGLIAEEEKKAKRAQRAENQRKLSQVYEVLNDLSDEELREFFEQARERFSTRIASP